MNISGPRLTGKTREQIAQALRSYGHDELIGVIYSLATVEQLLKPGEIAAREGRDRRDVIADMKAGAYVDGSLGPGYFAIGYNSLRAGACAVNARRAQWFVAIATDKKGSNGSERVSTGKRCGQNGEVGDRPEVVGGARK